MNQRELSERLLGYDAAEVSDSDPKQLTAKITRRDLRWTRLWSVAVILIWFLGTGLFLPPLAICAKTITETGVILQELIDVTEIDSNLPPLDQATEFLQNVGTGFTLYFLVAAVLTVLLIRSSRHATLRQVNANLMQISRQLEGLKAPANGASE